MVVPAENHPENAPLPLIQVANPFTDNTEQHGGFGSRKQAFHSIPLQLIHVSHWCPPLNHILEPKGYSNNGTLVYVITPGQKLSETIMNTS